MLSQASNSKSEAGPLRKMSLSVDDSIYSEHRRLSSGSGGGVRMPPSSTVNDSMAAIQDVSSFAQEGADRLESARTILSFSFTPRVSSPIPQPLHNITENSTEDTIFEAIEIVDAAQILLDLSRADSRLAHVALGLQSPFTDSQLHILRSAAPSPHSLSILQSVAEEAPQSPILDPSTPPPLSPPTLQSLTASSLALSQSIERARLAAIFTRPTRPTTNTPPKPSIMQISSILCCSPAPPSHLANATFITLRNPARLPDSTFQSTSAPNWSMPNWSAPTAIASRLEAVRIASEEISPRTLLPFLNSTETVPRERTPLPLVPYASSEGKRSGPSSSSDQAAKKRKISPDGFGLIVDGDSVVESEETSEKMDVDMDDVIEKEIAARPYGCSLCDRRFKGKWHRNRHEESGICVRKKGKGKGKKT